MSPSVLLQSASLLLTNASAPPTTNYSMLQGNYHIYNNNQPRTYAQVTDYTAAANAGTLRPISYSALGLPTFQQGSNASAPPKGFVPVKANIMEEFTQSRRDGMGALQMGGA